MSEKNINKKNEAQKSSNGVFITDYMQLSISNISFTIEKNGNIKSSTPIVKTSFDLTPSWIEIAFSHMRDAEKANKEVISSKENGAEGQMSNALGQEFVSGMQAITASAIAIEAFYACIKERIEVPKQLLKVWREKKTARYKQISEVIKLAFPMSNESFKTVRDFLNQIYDLRDKSVHPPSEATPTAYYPEINLSTDWRYVAFRYQNAFVAVKITLTILAQLSNRPKEKMHANLYEYSKNLKLKIEPLIKNWENEYEKIC